MVRTAAELARSPRPTRSPPNRATRVAIFLDDRRRPMRSRGEECRRRADGAREARNLCALPERPGPIGLAIPAAAKGTARNMNTVESWWSWQGSRDEQGTRDRHQFEGEQLESVFVGRRDGEPRPTVILIPTVMGVSDLEIGFGRQLVELGYNALVADLFGKEFHGAPRDTMFGEMTRLRATAPPSPPAATCARCCPRSR